MRSHLMALNQRWKQGVGNRMTTLIEQELFDEWMWRLLARLPSGSTKYFPLVDCQVTYLGTGNRQTGLNMQVNAGLGVKNLTAAPLLGVDGPVNTPIKVDTAFTFTTAGSDPTFPRIDAVFLKPNIASDNAQVVDIINPATLVITPTSMPQDRHYVVAGATDPSFAYVVGTPSGSPSAPPPPAGFASGDQIATILIAPGSGGFTPAGNLVDTRSLFSIDTNLVAGITSFPAAQVSLTPSILGQTQVQAALGSIVTSLSSVTAGAFIGFYSHTNTLGITLVRGYGGQILVEIGGVLVQLTGADLPFNLTTLLGVAPAVSTIYYLYLRNVGNVLTAAIDTVAPVRAGAGIGYHPTNTTWRYFTAVLTDASGNVVPVDVNGATFTMRIPPALMIISPAYNTTMNLKNWASKIPITARGINILASIVAINAALVVAHGSTSGSAASGVTPLFSANALTNNASVGNNQLQGSANGIVPVDDNLQVAIGNTSSGSPAASLVSQSIAALGWVDAFGIGAAH